MGFCFRLLLAQWYTVDLRDRCQLSHLPHGSNSNLPCEALHLLTFFVIMMMMMMMMTTTTMAMVMVMMMLMSVSSEGSSDDDCNYDIEFAKCLGVITSQDAFRTPRTTSPCD